MKIKKWQELTLKEKIRRTVVSLLLTVFIIFVGISLLFGEDKVTSQRQQGPLNPPRESQIEGVPIPFAAEDAGIKTEGAGLVLQTEGYRVKDASYSELKDWYEGLMPKGQSWNDWLWCSNAPKGGKTFDQRTYGSSVREQLLVVAIMADDPPSILISVTSERC